MKTKLLRERRNLVNRLKNKCTFKTIRENYGQAAVRKFEDKVRATSLPYHEQRDIIGDLSSVVANITPIKN